MANLAAEEEIARDVDRVAQAELLIDHFDMPVARFRGSREPHGLACDPHLSAIRQIGARDDLAER